jgi:hypothetical protein
VILRGAATRHARPRVGRVARDRRGACAARDRRGACAARDRRGAARWPHDLRRRGKNRRQRVQAAEEDTIAASDDSHDCEEDDADEELATVRTAERRSMDHAIMAFSLSPPPSLFAHARLPIHLPSLPSSRLAPPSVRFLHAHLSSLPLSPYPSLPLPSRSIQPPRLPSLSPALHPPLSSSHHNHRARRLRRRRPRGQPPPLTPRPNPARAARQGAACLPGLPGACGPPALGTLFELERDLCGSSPRAS